MKVLKNCNAQNITHFHNILIQKFAFFFLKELRLPGASKYGIVLFFVK